MPAGISIQMQLQGHRELMRALREFKPSVRRRIMRGAIRSAAGMIARSAKALAPVETGLLRRSIGVRMRVYARTGNVLAVVGPRRGKGAKVVRHKGKLLSLHTKKRQSAFADAKAEFRDPVKYAHLVEFGTGPHVQRGLQRIGDAIIPMVKHPGMTPRPFMRPALDRNRARAMKRIQDMAWKQIRAYAQRIKKGVRR